MKKVLFYVGLLVVATVAASIALGVDLKDFKREGTQMAGGEKKREVKYEGCYVALTAFKTYQKDIALRELNAAKIYTYGLGTGMGEDFDLTIERDLMENSQDIYTTFNALNDSAAIVLTTPRNSDWRLKSLTVDEKSFWDEKTREDYALCKDYEVEVKDEEYDAYLADNELVESGGDLFNYDPEKINSMYVAGEVIPARAVDRTWLNQTNNYTLLFDRFASQIKDSDLAITMLENPISGDPKPCSGCTTFVGDERNAKGFKEVGWDAFGVGNHFGDGGRNATKRTIEVMKEQDLAMPGASVSSSEEVAAPAILEFGDKKVALLSADDVAAFYWYFSEWGTNRYSSKSASGGIGAVDHEKIKKDIANAKSQADIVIVYMSWGIEYTNKSNTHQQEMGHAFIDAGADMVVGSHPHWVQEVETYKGKPIFYSLGNYIFDQTSEGPSADPSRRKGETRQGASMMNYYYDGKIVAVDLIMHKMCGYDQAGGEARNKTHNLAWKIAAGTMTYEEVDKYAEKDGCVWYQPTPVYVGNPHFKATWDRMMQFTKI